MCIRDRSTWVVRRKSTKKEEKTIGRSLRKSRNDITKRNNSSQVSGKRKRVMTERAREYAEEIAFLRVKRESAQEARKPKEIKQKQNKRQRIQQKLATIRRKPGKPAEKLKDTRGIRKSTRTRAR
eukprot:TRINITY_DN15400_c0_g1_i2.p1 TRINITY_DN15400_c0_g1~~TRINITY_DN15400_c0_g1_i2.p1  ORF type:complete len:125 (-),score=18.05 TRINITY_DN15400_c0_g1_i2:84-458(-)